jgi:chorismate synthase
MLTGEENADEMRMGEDGPVFLSNQAGGMLGGISTGQPHRGAGRLQADLLDPDAAQDHHASTAPRSRSRTKGRHDPCVGIRGVPVVEAMMACVLADAILRHRA